jgi:para-nitrobenzyl esterase
MDTLTMTGATWFPAPDGWNLPDVPATLIAQGSFAKVPLLLGSNGEEGSAFFLAGGPTVATASDFAALMDSRFPGHGQDILVQYPVAMFASPRDAAIAAVGDGAFVCPARRLARAYAGAGAPAHLYHFVHVTAAAQSLALGAYHSIEVGFVFGNPTTIEEAPLTVPEQGLSSAMMGYWGRMAASGDPNGGGAPTWPAYDATSDQDLALDLTISSESGLKKALCDFWDTLTP